MKVSSSLMTKFYNHPKRERWILGLVVLCFWVVVVEFAYNSFAAGNATLARQILFAPIAISTAFFIREVFRDKPLKRLAIPFLLLFEGMNLVRYLRKELFGEAASRAVLESLIFLI